MVRFASYMNDSEVIYSLEDVINSVDSCNIRLQKIVDNQSVIIKQQSDLLEIQGYMLSMLFIVLLYLVIRVVFNQLKYTLTLGGRRL